MAVELRPLGVRCNIQCEYCYQNPQRDAQSLARTYDIDLMKAAVMAHGGPFALFGGEPLMVPAADLERLWSWGLEQFGGNAVQTNGTRVTDEHIRMFKAYRVSVGISVDGPAELNDARRRGSLEQTRAATAKTLETVGRLCQEGLQPSLIVTHRLNASAERLGTLCRWFRDLECVGVRTVRLHLLESETEAVRAKLALSPEENLRGSPRVVRLATRTQHVDVRSVRRDASPPRGTGQRGWVRFGRGATRIPLKPSKAWRVTVRAAIAGAPTRTESTS